MENALILISFLLIFLLAFVAKHRIIRQQSQAMLKICRTELTEIETCSECYYNANTNNVWFVEACDRPHLLVWAKLKGFPFWPAKAMSISGTQVDVRFFGEHDRAWIPNTACLLYSEKDPNPLSKSKKNNINDCIKEVNKHIEKLKEKFGAFNYAEFRSPLELGMEQEYIKNMLPNLRKAELKTEIKAKSLTLKFVKQPGLATKNDATKIYQVMNNNGDESEQVRSMILKRKDNWKSVPVEASLEEEPPLIVPMVPKKGKIKNSTVVLKKEEQNPSTSIDNSNMFQRVYSAASGLLGVPNIESKKNAVKRRKSTRPATIILPSSLMNESNEIEKITTEPIRTLEGKKINARKTRSKSGPLEPSDEPPPKSARMAARLKTMKPQDPEVAATTVPKDPEISLKGVKGRLKNRLKSTRNVTHEKENHVEEQKSIKSRKIEEESEAILNVIVKLEPLSDDENGINENQLDTSDELNFSKPSTEATALDLPTEKPLHQHPVARKARKTFPKKLPIPIMPSVTVQSDVLDQMTTINSMVCIPQSPKLNPSKISEIPPLVAMCQPSTSSTSSTSSIKLKTLAVPLFPVVSTNGDSYQKSSILPNMSIGMASAIAETIIGSAPPKLTPRPPHPLRSDGTTFHRDCGPVTRTLNDNAHSMTDFFRKLILDILSEISSVHPEARVHALQVQMEEMNAQHEREITDIKRNTGEL